MTTPNKEARIKAIRDKSTENAAFIKGEIKQERDRSNQILQDRLAKKRLAKKQHGSPQPRGPPGRGPPGRGPPARIPCYPHTVDEGYHKKDDDKINQMKETYETDLERLWEPPKGTLIVYEWVEELKSKIESLLNKHSNDPYLTRKGMCQLKALTQYKLTDNEIKYVREQWNEVLKNIKNEKNNDNQNKKTKELEQANDLFERLITTNTNSLIKRDGDYELVDLCPYSDSCNNKGGRRKRKSSKRKTTTRRKRKRNNRKKRTTTRRKRKTTTTKRKRNNRKKRTSKKY